MECAITQFIPHTSNLISKALTNLEGISFTVPAGTGSHSVSVSIQDTDPVYSSYYYAGLQHLLKLFKLLAASVSSTVAVPTYGAITTIQGTNFGPGSPLPEVLINGLACTGVIFISPHYSFQCNVPAGVGGAASLTVAVDGIMGVPTTFSYQGNFFM